LKFKQRATGSQLDDGTVGDRPPIHEGAVNESAIGAVIDQVPSPAGTRAQFQMLPGNQGIAENHMIVWRAANADRRLILKLPLLQGSLLLGI
jgi:hypothetical protein